MPLSSPALLPGLEPAPARTVLWVDRAGSDCQPACKLLAAQQIAVHCIDSFAEALGQIPRLHPHLLLLAYSPAVTDMSYETFVYTELPRVDPYRPQGPWAVNPWRYTEIPILLQAADLAPGHLAPLLHRAYPLSIPYEPCLLLPRVLGLLPTPQPGLILDADRQRIWWQGRSHRVPPRGLDILYLLARSHPQPLTAAQLARQLGDYKGVHTTDTQVRMAIRRLHQRLPAGHPALIANHRPGYCLTQAPAAVPSADLALPRLDLECK